MALAVLQEVTIQNFIRSLEKDLLEFMIKPAENARQQEVFNENFTVSSEISQFCEKNIFFLLQEMSTQTTYEIVNFSSFVLPVSNTKKLVMTSLVSS